MASLKSPLDGSPVREKAIAPTCGYAIVGENERQSDIIGHYRHLPHPWGRALGSRPRA
jgi:hypothetical protein